MRASCVHPAPPCPRVSGSPFARSLPCPIATAARLWEETSRVRNRCLEWRLPVCRRDSELLERWGCRQHRPGQVSSFLALGPGRHSRRLRLEQHRLRQQQRHLRDHRGLGHLCHGPCREGQGGLLEPCRVCYVGCSGDKSVEAAEGRVGVGSGSRCHGMVSPKSHQCRSRLGSRKKVWWGTATARVEKQLSIRPPFGGSSYRGAGIALAGSGPAAGCLPRYLGT